MALWVWWMLALLVGLALTAGFAFYFSRRAKKPSGEILHDEKATKQEVLSELIPDSLFIEVDGVKVHYVQAGTGKDLVLLHGIGASVFIWRFLFPLLQDRYRVTAVDLPGFGRSAKSSSRDYGLDSQAAIVARF